MVGVYHAAQPKFVNLTAPLKGLEADVAVILNPAVMDHRHLYLAMTRGAKHLIVCSPQQILTPA
jgi:DNA helicase IV